MDEISSDDDGIKPEQTFPGLTVPRGYLPEIERQAREMAVEFGETDLDACRKIVIAGALSRGLAYFALSPSDKRGPALVRCALEFEGHPFFGDLVTRYESSHQLSMLLSRYRRHRGDSWSTSAYRDVYKRDGARCRYCGSTEALSVDHVVPRAQGGSDEPNNLVVACRSCNSRKGARTPAEAGMVLQ